MLVQSMTWEEIYRELSSEYTQVQGKAMIKLKAAAEAAMRKKQRIISEVFRIETKNKNQWHVAVRLGGSFEVAANTFLVTTDKQGIVAFSGIKVEDRQLFMKHNTHFLKRYKERMKLDLVKPEQVIIHFFKNNTPMAPFISTEPFHGLHYVSIAFSHGFGLGLYDKEVGMMHLKTFISEDLYNEDQQKMLALMENEDKESGEIEVPLSQTHLKRKL